MMGLFRTLRHPAGTLDLPQVVSSFVEVAIAAGFAAPTAKAAARMLPAFSTLICFCATAAPTNAQITFTEYAGPTTPIFESGYTMTGITPGSDGNLWFTEGYAFGVPTQIGRITPGGITTYFNVPSGSSETLIATGPDGNLWFAEYRTNRITRLTTTGVFTEFLIPSGGAYPSGITAGPDGNIWFTETLGGRIGRITPSGSFAEFPIPGESGSPGICAGTDGNLWFTENFANNIGRITPAGVITEFAIPTPNSYPVNIILGQDGNLWFTEDLANKIGRVTPGGVITEFAIPTAGSLPVGICTGPDGNVWFTEDAGDQIGRITPSGVITEFAIPSHSRMACITTGPDGNLWFLESTANKIVKAVLTPAYTVAPLYDQSQAHRRGSTVPVKLAVLDGSGADVSSPSLQVHAVSVTLISGAAPGPLDDSGASNPDFDFRFDAALGTGGGYIFNLSLAGFSTGTYSLNFTIGSDPSPHSVRFQVR